jgi:hypothetical protein
LAGESFFQRSKACFETTWRFSLLLAAFGVWAGAGAVSLTSEAKELAGISNIAAASPYANKRIIGI